MPNNLNISTKLLVYIVLTALAGLGATLALVSYSIRQDDLRTARRFTDAQAARHAQAIEGYLNSFCDPVRHMAVSLGQHNLLPEPERRRFYGELAFQTLEANKHLVSLWAILGANALGPDTLYANQTFNTPQGVFAPYVQRFSGTSGRGHAGERGEIFSREEYTVVLDNKMENILPPSLESLDGIKPPIWQTTFAVPVASSSEVFGVVCAQIPLDRVQHMLDTLRLFKNHQAMVINQELRFVAHTNREFVMVSMNDFNRSFNGTFNVQEKIRRGEPCSFFTDEGNDDREAYVSFAPIHVGLTRTPWSLALYVPKAAFLLEANDVVFLFVISTSLSLFLMGLVILALTLKITRPLAAISETLRKLNRGDISLLEDIADRYNDEIGEIASSAYTLIHWLNSTGEFAKEIGEGQLDAQYRMLSEDDVLGKKLIDMRDRLKEAREEEAKRRLDDQHRNWASEGVAKFADILRQNNDNMEEYSYSIVSNLVKYMDANQGALFLINDEEPGGEFIELQASYAYGKRRYRDKRIDMGVGLVGRCIQENETIYLTDLPEGYTSISSGLGDETPGSLLIVPLIFNDKTFGVIEVASFRPIEPYQVEFVERLGESIASTISAVKINLRTTSLLEQSRRQSQELAEKEEQMRLSIEQLTADWELSERRRKEMEARQNAIEGSLPTAIYDPESSLAHANASFLKLLGYTFRELRHKKQALLLERSHGHSHEHSEFWEALRDGSPIWNRMVHLTKTKERKFLASVFVPIADEAGNVAQVIQHAYDLTDLEERDHQQEELLEAVKRNMQVLELDPTGRIVSMNRAFSKTFKTRAEDAQGKHHSDFVHQDYRELSEYSHIWSKLTRGKAVAQELKMVTAEDAELWMQNLFIPVTSLSGQTLKIVCISNRVIKDEFIY